MIVEFELQGSRALHKGIFDTTGFWVKYEPQLEDDMSEGGGKFIDGWKIYSHCSFSFYHVDVKVADLVYSKLISVLRGSNSVDIEAVGYFRKVNK